MRNIVLIFVDTLRPDHLGCYGYGRATSPFIDEIAGRSLVLDSCYSASNFTAPAFTSVFTAAYPSQHGVFDFTAQATSSPIKQICDERGLHTAGVVSFRFFERLLGRIWGELEAVTDTRSFDYSKELPQAVSDGACDWLEQCGQRRPFCLFLHYDAPHAPYRLPPSYDELYADVAPDAADPAYVHAFYPQDRERLGRSTQDDPSIRGIHALTRDVNFRKRRPDPATLRFLIDRYDASIRYNDDMLARVYRTLEETGLLTDTVIGIFSDHGEEFLDHGHLGHGGIHLYDEIIRTVGIIHDPQRPQARRLAEPVSHVQILPTLLSLAGLAPLPQALSELALPLDSPRLENDLGSRPLFCVGEFKTAVRLGRYKWIHASPTQRLGRLRRLWLRLRLLQVGETSDELYDMIADPGETAPRGVARRHMRPLAAALKTHRRQDRYGRGGITADRDISLEERKRIEQELEDLGYM